MSSMNRSTNGRMRTANRSGHAAYSMGDRERLVTMALTTMLGEPKFYGDNTDDMIQLAESMCESGDGEFVAKLAVWARTKGNMRSASHALVAVAARKCPGKGFVRPAVREIALMRGDDGTEVIATYAALYGRRIPHSVIRGVRDALSQAGAFTIAKYQSRAREWKLRDVLRLTHPVPKDADAERAMRECIDGTLAMPKGWETELSARGNTAEVWNELLSERKVGFMAALRNMRNIIQSGADVQPVLDMLMDEGAVRRSRQLPFRFFSAWRELRDAGLATTGVTRALDAAMTHACSNMDALPGRTAVMIDTSGSMGSPVSSRSRVACADIAAVLAAMVVRTCDDAWVCKFDSNAAVVPMMGVSVLADVQLVPRHGGWTDMTAAFYCLSKSGFDADRVILISDNEVNYDGYPYNPLRYGGSGKRCIQSELDAYRRKVGHDVWCHGIDLQGYGTQQFHGDKFNIIAGWSEQVMRFVSMAEQGSGGIVAEIDSMSL